MRSPLTPTLSVVGSATGTASLAGAIVAGAAGKRTLVHGLDIGYQTVGSRHLMELKAGGSVIWSKAIVDELSVDWGQSPLQVTAGNSLQLTGPPPGTGLEARATIRYRQENTG